jgi:hypothetical protein
MTFDQKKKKYHYSQGGSNGSMEVKDVKQTVPEISDLLDDIDSLLNPVEQKERGSRDSCRC